nr:hypothetical protein [Asaia prunellae]
MSGVTAISPAIESFLSRAHQGEARSLLQRQGLPQRRLEAWRYTPLRDLDKSIFTTPEAVLGDEAEALLARLAPEALEGHRVVFVNGVAVSALTSLPDTVEIVDLDTPLLTDRPLSVLNSAVQQPGLALRVAAGIDAGRIALVSLVTSGNQVSTHLAHQITLEAGAKLTLLDIQSGEGTYLANPGLTVSVAEKAHLTHLRVQQDSLRRPILHWSMPGLPSMALMTASR